MWNGLEVFVYGYPDVAFERSQFREAMSTLAVMFQVAIPIAYLIVRSGEGCAAFGIRKPKLIMETGGAALITIIDLVVLTIFGFLLYTISTMTPAFDRLFYGDVYEGSNVTRHPEVAMWVSWFWYGIMLVANSIGEELVFRGFILQRLAKIFRHPAVPLIASSALFASYHIYTGLYGVVGAMFGGLLLGAVFLMYRRLLMCIIAHTLFNFCVAMMNIASVYGY